MAEHMAAPRAEDLLSVGTRISWGAIAAGAVVAFGLQLLLAVLGGAAGMSVSERVEAENLRTAAIIWTIASGCAALFVGGMVTSQFTVGENKLEAALYGIIMWAALSALVLVLGATGPRVGWGAIVGMGTVVHGVSADTWETAARNAGIPAEQIDEWRGKLRAPDTATQERRLEASKRVAWYAFGGIWVSMLAAALGALAGAGPTIRLLAAPLHRLS